MDEEWHRNKHDLAELAKAEGADYYDPEGPVLWKRFIIGPIPWWRRLFWAVFPPGIAALTRLQNDRVWREVDARWERRQAVKDGRAQSSRLKVRKRAYAGKTSSQQLD